MPGREKGGKTGVGERLQKGGRGGHIRTLYRGGDGKQVQWKTANKGLAQEREGGMAKKEKLDTLRGERKRRDLPIGSDRTIYGNGELGRMKITTDRTKKFCGYERGGRGGGRTRRCAPLSYGYRHRAESRTSYRIYLPTWPSFGGHRLERKKWA